jgi:WD40 repeat protein
MEKDLQERGMDNSLQREQQKADEEGDEVEIIDLEHHDSRRGSQCFWPVPFLLRWQCAPSRQYWRVMSTVGFVLLLVVLLNASSLFSSSLSLRFKGTFFSRSPLQSLPPLPASTLPTLPQQDGISCLSDATWSPDSHFIAVLGYQQNCSPELYVPGLVNLYEAHTGTLLTQVHPDGAILQALNQPLTAPPQQAFSSSPSRSTVDASGLAIHYVHVIWSPDSQRLAFTFTLAAQSSVMNGVVLMSRGGAHPQVWFQHQHPTAPSYAEWDVERRKPIASTTVPLPPALAYHWGTYGTLLPKELPPTTSGPANLSRGPIGNPDGDHSFTIWQPALMHAILFTDASGSYSISTWRTSFAAWSPDGHYLVEGLGLPGLLAPADRPFPSHKVVHAFNVDQAPILPLRDAAMYEVVESAGIEDTDTVLTLAWSPNGRMLAAYQAGNTLALYNGTNGHKLAAFALPGKPAAPPADAVALRWSPDGSHLLLSSMSWGLIALWSL